ncbi:4014_t:CDS:2 [Entrophospora sp. SA101]|nr:2067_t:CDS:2 [Entrophospora sp. SA101]CAJ0757033.1 4014_t:CDS:2 [Entrophospora sp. SA101]
MYVVGQGAQYVGMGKDFYEKYSVSREVFDEANQTLGFNLTKLIFDGDQLELTQTENAQPAILMTSVAILRVLEKEYGFDLSSSCNFALGHSLGEYVTLVATKSLSLSDAIKLVRLRGNAMSRTVSNLGVKTAMAALIVREENLDKLQEAIKEINTNLPKGESVELANINSAVISGTSEGVDLASSALQLNHLAARAVYLPVSAPFHCKLMDPAREMMKDALNGVKFQTPIVDVISNVTARPQVTATVQWQKSIKYCKERGVDNFLLIGPAKVLANLLRKEYPMDLVRFVCV